MKPNTFSKFRLFKLVTNLTKDQTQKLFSIFTVYKEIDLLLQKQRNHVLQIKYMYFKILC